MRKEEKRLFFFSEEEEEEKMEREEEEEEEEEVGDRVTGRDGDKDNDEVELVGLEVLVIEVAAGNEEEELCWGEELGEEKEKEFVEEFFDFENNNPGERFFSLSFSFFCFSSPDLLGELPRFGEDKVADKVREGEVELEFRLNFSFFCLTISPTVTTRVDLYIRRISMNLERRGGKEGKDGKDGKG